MKSVIFALGPADGLSARQLTVTPLPDAADDSPADAHDADEGAVTVSQSISLEENRWYQAVLIDTSTAGHTSRPDILVFFTGEDSIFPGPGTGDRLKVLCMDDESSSSSDSSSSASSASSSSSSSSSISTSSESSSSSSHSSSSQSTSSSSSWSSHSSSSQSSQSSSSSSSSST